jgi:hypothetical protein
VFAGREPQDELPGVADQPAGDGDQPPPQGLDHGIAAADTVTGQDGFTAGGGSELVQSGGHAGREQRALHPGGIDLDVSRCSLNYRASMQLRSLNAHMDATRVPGERETGFRVFTDPASRSRPAFATR